MIDMNDKCDMTTSAPRLCSKTDELIELNEHLGFYLKEAIKVSITCQLPAMKTPGQCVSTLTLTEKLRRKARPHVFVNLKVVKNTLTFIRFEGEVESKQVLNHVLNKFNKLSIKLSGFSEKISIKVCKMKMGSTRHEWESFFRDNPHMNEMKPGFRPDTIHVQNLPIKWFGGHVPKAHILLKTFEVFGEIRRFHIPLLDEIESNPFSERCETKGGGFKRFNFTESLNFDAYVMYRDYISFVKAMDTLRGMKLVKKLDEANRYIEYDIQCDFDKTKHLSDKAIKKRQLARKYGIKNSEELKTFKEEVLKERERYQERIKLLKNRKTQAKRLLEVLFSRVGEEELKKKKFEDEMEERRKARERLLLEEQSLREKLIEKRKEALRNKLKEVGGLRSVALPTTSTINTVKTTEMNTMLYKNHKPTCKHYKTKSVVIPSKKSERNKITYL
ncbi:A-kinase anchor protein 17A-like protein [Leptotrombidium deliense]|uniref:A-kinase anchor protein 17A-like protein n=1 Tax=Leptotrombidium deliense TaxID=299467 RepID=A0A443SGG5_9ACAR|nr:A-kinase anchor protein 17A-like protein [Leptotrombidium deliense]